MEVARDFENKERRMAFFDERAQFEINSVSTEKYNSEKGGRGDRRDAIVSIIRIFSSSYPIDQRNLPKL